ncbi:serine hydrolase domain-containing protein [Flavivirga eckloniae]|uniref:Serine hydrolase n=1 Tax=Flavivirga eckloniae TaxID=1803846 RepID=A0A2K9PKW6_9FLAO|nr:serine hydrolase [Flavivirga eckloniae]AUP77675.1 serine hydrolase [Flavivirga eckloniae]
MKYFCHTFFLLIILGFISCKNPSQKKTEITENATPESLGISSQAILDFINAAEKELPNSLHSFYMLRHGKEVASGWWDPYEQEAPHSLYSLSKSFTSTAIGIAQEEGLLSINDSVISFFPEETPDSISPNLKAMRIRDLLKMNSGHNLEPWAATTQNKESWVKGFLSAKVEHKPGTHFVYNSMATFMLSAIITKVTGERLRDYLMPRLFDPLKIENPTWDQNVNGIDFGGWGLHLRTEDIAKFGQLYLQKGKWNDVQLVPEAWVEEATSFQTSNGSDPNSDWEQGYGYQFWMCRHGFYRGDGAFGQFCIVMPEQDAVLAMTSGTQNMKKIMNLAWDHLLPAFKNEPLKQNDSLLQILREKTANLKLSPVEGEKTSSKAEEISGETYTLDNNNWGLQNITFNMTGDEKSIVFKSADSTYTLPIGFGEYQEGYYKFSEIGKQSVATSAAWITKDTLQLMMYIDETPHAYTAKVSFGENKMTMERELNVFFGETKQKPLEGKTMK